MGREHDIARIVALLRDGRFLAVLGSSGAGKSSLIRAGLLPALRAGALPGSARWPMVTMTPGDHPLQALAKALRRMLPAAPALAAADLETDPGRLEEAIAAIPWAAGALLAVDQLEELFTLCASRSERQGFLDAVLQAASIPDGRLRVVFGMRADFYPRCAEHSLLRTLLTERQYLVGPMARSDIARAIEEPARRVGLDLEPGLTRTILEDVTSGAGGLPLLQHLLFELWRRRRGQRLTLQGYVESGGVQGALAQAAEAAFLALPVAQRVLARRLLLRLTQPGDGTQDTRRRAELAEFPDSGEQGRDSTAALAALTEARLVVTGRDPVSGEPVAELVHDVLMRAWPRLRGWIEEDRERLRAGAHLAAAAAEWERAGRDEGLLYRGARSAAWREYGIDELSARERSFLMAGEDVAARERRLRGRRRRLALAASGVGLAVVSALASLAIVQRDRTQQERAESRSRGLAALAQQETLRDPEAAVATARQADRAAATPEARQSLRQAIQEPALRGLVETGAPLYALAPLDAARVAVAGEDGLVRVWRGRGKALDGSFRSGAGQIYALAATAGGRLVASVGEDGAVRLSDGAGESLGSRRFGAATALTTAVDGDGETLAVGTAEGRLIVESIATRRRSIDAQVDLAGITAVAMTPNGTQIVAAGAGGLIRMFAPPAPRPTWSAPPQPDGIAGLVLSRDGRTLVTGGLDGRVAVWRPPRRVPLVLPREGVADAGAVAISRDGRLVAAADSSGAIRVWHVTGGPSIMTLRGHSGVVTGLAFGARGTVLRSTAVDGQVRSWAIGDRVWSMPADGNGVPVGGVRFAASGAALDVVRDGGSLTRWTWRTGVRDVTLRGGEGAFFAGSVDPTGSAMILADGLGVTRWDADRSVRLAPPELEIDLLLQPADGQALVGVSHFAATVWRLDADSEAPERIPVAASEGLVAAALDPGGERLAVADGAGVIRMVAITDGEPVDQVQVPGRPSAVALRDGAVAVGGLDGAVHLAASSGRVRRLGAHSQRVNAVAIAPDGRYVVSAANDGLIVWDPRDPGLGVRLGGFPGRVGGVTISPHARHVAAWGAATPFGGPNDDVHLRVFRCLACEQIGLVRRAGAERAALALIPEQPALAPG